MVNRRRIGSQRQFVELLAEAGYSVTQATVSRDLDAIGAQKHTNGDGTVSYAIDQPVATSEVLGALERAFAEFVEEIVPSGNLVVLKTPPGAAQVVAGALDRARLDTVAGTVAGDDTVLAVAGEEDGAWRLAKELERIGAGR
jgi:transcriptional regulator of arginine metabolism